jgi:hypothetical protein
LLRGEHRLVERLAVGEAVVADDVVHVRPALGVRRVGADRVEVALHRTARLGVVERDRQLDEAARDLGELLEPGMIRSSCSTSASGRTPSYVSRIDRKPGAVSTRPSIGSARSASSTASTRKFSVRSSSIGPYSTSSARSPAYR